MTQISMAEAYDDRSVIKKISDLDGRVEALEEGGGGSVPSSLVSRVAALENTSANHTTQIASNTSKISTNTTNISANSNKISALTMGQSDIQSTLNELSTSKQPKNLSFSYDSITWAEDTTYTDLGYIYKAELPASGVTAAMTAQVTFDMVSAASGNVAPICETGAGIITVWAKEALTDATADAVVFQ